MCTRRRENDKVCHAGQAPWACPAGKIWHPAFGMLISIPDKLTVEWFSLWTDSMLLPTYTPT